MTPDQIDRLLRLTSFEYCDSIWWRIGHSEWDGDRLVIHNQNDLLFIVGCNDVFEWGTADGEPILGEDDLAGLEAAVAECEAIMGKFKGVDGFYLWVARKRGVRPQGAMYKHLDEELHHLFDACGPEREIDYLNPKEQPTVDA